MNFHAVILAGGKGERFWPASRVHRPKHLLTIVGDHCMLRQTVERLEQVVPLPNIWVVTQPSQTESILKKVPDLTPENILEEPEGKDTAAAITFAMASIHLRDPKAIVGMFPADHVIHNTDRFCDFLKQAFPIAEAHPKLLTVGIKPTHPATGYGYIQRGPLIPHSPIPHSYRVERFVEKPNISTARRYVDSRNYYWNGGIFIWSTSTFAEALETHSPEHFQMFQRIQSEPSSLKAAYAAIPKISIDYALLEKAENRWVLEAPFDWDDVGEWTALTRHYALDANQNLLQGQTLVQEGSGNIVMSSPDHLVACLGMDNFIVIQTPDATLICPKNRSQDIKHLVHSIEKLPQGKSYL
jgi:mannose-1-phosphate guanylyltransferase